jgi:hypothetical protein
MTKRINRRYFIEASALAAGATMLGPAIIEALGIGTVLLLAALRPRSHYLLTTGK